MKNFKPRQVIKEKDIELGRNTAFKFSLLAENGATESSEILLWKKESGENMLTIFTKRLETADEVKERRKLYKWFKIII
jgi:hypothetical protein